jgi:chorismate mutase
LNLEIKELKASIESGRAQIQAAEEAIVQLTEQGGKLKEQVAEAKVNSCCRRHHRHQWSDLF